MAVYLVSWNLNKEKTTYNQARDAFFALIKQYPYAYDSNLDSVVFIQTEQPAQQLYTQLGAVLDKNDRILITQMTRGAYVGWLNQDVVNWLNARV